MRVAKWLAILGMTLSFPLGAFAALDLGASGLSTAGTNAGVATTGAAGSLAGMVGVVTRSALNLLGVLLFIYFIYAGFLWMTAQGDEKQVKKAKDIMRNAGAGLIVVLLAYSLSFYALTYLASEQVSDVGMGELVDVANEAGISAGMTDPLQIIGYYLSVALNILGVVLFAIFLYAGWLWMTAAGDSKQTGKAKDMMRNAVVGLVIILSARILAGFVVDQLAGDGAGVLSLEQTSPIHNG